MDINKILTYALVALTGMIMATFAAYYFLNEFVYPQKLTDIETEVTEQMTDMLNEPPVVEEATAVPDQEVTPPTMSAVTFSGTLEAVDTGCFVDKECFAVVDGKHVTAVIGWSREVVGSVVGVQGFGDLEQYIGMPVEVYAQDLGNGTYTLYGSESYYIKVLK